MKFIPLTRGMFAKVDDADYALVSQFDNWIAFKDPKSPTNWYAKRQVKKSGHGKYITMHKFLVPYKVVDHHNGDGLDNQRINLRDVTVRQNSQNARKHLKSKSKYKGVFPNHGNWQASICFNYQKTYLGTRKTEEEAAKLYDAAALQMFGEFARINFPQGD